VFNRVAEAYASRPPYPEALLRRLLALSGGPGQRVADLGAGTGHLALPLAALGLAVTAVEPARAMLSALRARRPEGVPLAAIHARAEETHLPGGSFALVLLADALQWVDPELTGREVARLLAPGGVLAVVLARFARTPFMEGLGALLLRANPRARGRPAEAARELFGLAVPGGVPAVETFRQEARLDGAGLRALLASLSYVGPALGPAAFERLLGEAEALARRTGGAAFGRELTLRWCARPRP